MQKIAPLYFCTPEIFSRSQARLRSLVSLVPKPQLGNALAGEAPASRDGRRP